MNFYKRAMFVVFFAFFFGMGKAVPIAIAAQARPEKPTVRIGYASQSGAFAQLWIAAQRGYFSAEGLNRRDPL